MALALEIRYMLFSCRERKEGRSGPELAEVDVRESRGFGREASKTDLNVLRKVLERFVLR